MIKRTVIILLLVGLAVYIGFAITKLNKPNPEQVCTGVDLCVKDSAKAGFINTAELKRLLQKGKIYPKGTKLDSVDLRRIERTLQKNPFIEKAECFKTPTGRVSVSIWQRLPIVRVMDDKGGNYYLDARGNVMPNADYPAHLVVATGSIGPKYAKRYLIPLGKMLGEDEFWNDQIEQINVLPSGEMQLVPRVGDHIVFLGQPRDLKGKLSRLRTFYQDGLDKIGWNKYSQINLEFENQIICTKNK